MPKARPVPLDPESTSTPRPLARIAPIGWDDVIHLRPDSMLSPEEALARKRDRAIRISQSTQSPLSRALTATLTWFDDIQDALLTASVAARAIAVKIPRIRPLAVLLGGAADATNLGALVKRARPTGNQGKRNLETRLQKSPGYYRGRARNATSLTKALPNLAETLQIAQTTDQLAGVGISLGALMGSPLAVWDQYQAAKAAGLVNRRLEAEDPTVFDDPDRLWELRKDETARLENLLTTTAIAVAVGIAAPAGTAIGLGVDWIGRQLQNLAGSPRASAETLRRTFEAVNGLSGTDDVFTPHEHLMIATAHHWALDALTQSIPPIGFAGMSHPFRRSIITPPTARDPLTRLVLAELGVNPDNPGPFPLPGSPTRLPLQEWQEAQQELAPAALASWRSAVVTEEQEDYAGALACFAARTPWNTIAGTDVQWQDSYSPTGRAAVTILDYAIDLDPDTTDADLSQTLELLGAAWYMDDDRAPDPLTAQTEFDATLALIREAHLRE